MPRARNIKPGFFKNDALAECNPLARILFVGLWCEADREGRLEDRPKRLKAEYLPYDQCDIGALLDELEQHAFVVRYVVGGVGYIAIPNFTKHQNPHVREPASLIPAPGEHGANHGGAQNPHSASTVQEQAAHSSGPADSPSLIPDSPSQRKTLAQIAERSTDPAANLERFWSAYPRHVGKRAAVKALTKLRPDEALMGVMLAALAKQRQSDQWQRDGGRYIPHAATWLNGRRWEDEAEPARSNGAHAAPGNDDESWLRRAV
ncbi:hypothetical protein [Rhodanobacter aciditrophus]|uniref:hypothetical protein n=1 Tax=Rhodanobacter aciditrophus TaxID=1623218 RepID=UPI003CE67809